MVYENVILPFSIKVTFLKGKDGTQYEFRRMHPGKMSTDRPFPCVYMLAEESTEKSGIVCGYGETNDFLKFINTPEEFKKIDEYYNNKNNKRFWVLINHENEDRKKILNNLIFPQEFLFE
jgi:hypothetical protein